ncbi:TraR/DksA family transcriptional regulator [Nitriliruptoraceae bacterium ZYF776]|nr:TraR/DksA family transcriptional regulator [Profundirhabdus halotolerans]
MTARKLTKTQTSSLRDALLEEREQLLEQVADLSQEAGVDNWRGDGSGDDPADRGTASSERETAASLSDHARRLLEQIDDALRRMEQGTYGTCERCGKPIGYDRLEVLPQAALCMDCKRLVEAGR